MSAVIRDMTAKDIDGAGEMLFKAFNDVSSKHGHGVRIHNQQVAKVWAWSMLHYGHSDLLVAEIGNRVAGICCLNPRGRVGNVGPVAVHPDFQGHAVGRELMNALLKRAEGLESLRVIQEAFNRASFSLYYSLNFMPVATVLELFLDGSIEKESDRCCSNNIRELSKKDLDEIHAYDNPRSKLDRRSDLEYYDKWGSVFVCRNQDQIRGFLACLPGSEFVQLGPLLAEGEEEAICLFRHAVEVFKGRDCRTRVMARDYVLVRALNGLHFRLQSVNNLMVRGSWRPDVYVEAFGIFPDGA